MIRRLTAIAVALCLLLCCAVASADSIYPMEGKSLTVLTTVDSDLALFGFSSYADTPGFQQWQKATGVDVAITEVVDTSALLLQLAGGDLPDIVRCGKNFYPKGFAAMVDEGVATVLTDKLPEYAPNYWAFLNSSENIYNSAALAMDGSLEIISFAGNFYPETSPFRNYGGILVRKDFMDKLGMDAIVTLDDFTTYLRRCKEELGVSTPLMSQDYQARYVWQTGLITSPFGLVSAGAYQVDGVYHYGAYEPEFKDVLSYLHDLYTEGLMDPNFAVTDANTAIAAMTSGDSCAIRGMTSYFQNIKNAANNDEMQLTAIPALVAKEGDVPFMSFATTITSNSFWCFVTDECKDVETALRFMDYLYTPEGMDLANYGIEGETFEYDADGNPKFTEFVTNNPDGYAVDPIMRSYGLINWSCIHRQAFSEQRFPLPEQREACNIWAASDYNKYMISYSSVPADLQEENTRLWTDLETYMNEHVANIITGADSLDTFDDYIAGMKALGMDRYIEIQQLAIDPYYKD